MIFLTWLLIVGMIIPAIYQISFVEWYIQPLLIIPVIGIFVGALVVMKRKLLKPLYKEFEPTA